MKADKSAWAAIPPGQIWFGWARDVYQPEHPVPAPAWRCNIDGCAWSSGLTYRRTEEALAGAERHRRKDHPNAPAGAVRAAPTFNPDDPFAWLI